jgi:hypothetical protein
LVVVTFEGRESQCDAAHITASGQRLSRFQADSSDRDLETQFRLWVTIERKGLSMKNLVLTIATVATLAAVASAPAEARGGRMRAGVAAATAAAIAADAYFNGGYGYYYGAPVYNGGPVYYGYPGWRYY